MRVLELFIEDVDAFEVQRQVMIVLLFWTVMILAVLIDLWTGIEKAKATGMALHSHALRCTVTKIGEYWRVQLMFLLFDILALSMCIYALPYASMVGTVAVVAIEVRSVFENLREKRSSAADVPDMLLNIIRCKDVEGARRLLETIDKEEKEKRNETK